MVAKVEIVKLGLVWFVTCTAMVVSSKHTKKPELWCLMNFPCGSLVGKPWSDCINTVLYDLMRNQCSSNKIIAAKIDRSKLSWSTSVQSYNDLHKYISLHIQVLNLCGWNLLEPVLIYTKQLRCLQNLHRLDPNSHWNLGSSLSRLKICNSLLYPLFPLPAKTMSWLSPQDTILLPHILCGPLEGFRTTNCFHSRVCRSSW